MTERYICHANNVAKEKIRSKTEANSICTALLLPNQWFFEFSEGVVEFHKMVVILKKHT